VLRRHPAVAGALVSARETDTCERSLVAYIVPSEPGAATADELRRFLAEQLPAAMMPAAFVTLAEFPLAPNGKVDRRALPAPEQARPELEVGFVLPMGESEEQLAAVWSEVLGIGEIGATDDFFALGGDSFKAMRIVRKAGGSLRVVDLFQNPTIRGLARVLSGTHQPEDGVLHRLTRPAGKESLHLVCVPYGGGSAIVYQPLAAALPDGFVVSAVALPGHDVGRPHEPLAPLDVVTLACVEEIRRRSDLPVVVYGHCLGVALAVEIARLLEEESSLELRAVFLSGAYPPRRKRSLLASVLGRAPLYSLDTDAEIHAGLKALGGFEGLDDPAEIEFVMRSFRHDGRCFEEFFQRESIQPGGRKIKAPVFCVIGNRDPLTAGYGRGYRRWEWFAETVELVVLEGGGHYFIKHRAAELAQRIVARVGAEPGRFERQAEPAAQRR
ncbi:MAG: alpha/beta fold hydrolase, partial [Thermoanaerobaculia bacterium]